MAAGIGSVRLAALFSFGMLAGYTTHMLSLAAAALDFTVIPTADASQPQHAACLVRFKRRFPRWPSTNRQF